MKNKNANVIHYGIGKDYLPKWGLKQALREVYQNFLDYGQYSQTVEKLADNKVRVTITNDYNPSSLEFLRIGKSDKGANKEAIGKHGEGLKMAFLIFERMGYKSKLFTNTYVASPTFIEQPQVGPCFSMQYKNHGIQDKAFSIQFICPKPVFEEFNAGILSDEDIIFKSYCGDIVNKTAGNVYVGKLFVCNLKNFSKAYNFLPSNIPLDRDREVPREFDVSYYGSQVNAAHGKWDAKDTTYSDTAYIMHVPEEKAHQFKPKQIGNTIEFVVTNENGEDEVVKNEHIRDALFKMPSFSAIVASIKRRIVRAVGILELLQQFKAQYIQPNSQQERDFDLILERFQ